MMALHRKAEANFNPGLARSLTAYCVNGLVLYSTSSQVFISRSSHAGELPASYRQEAAEDGWKQMQARFKTYNVLG